MRMELFPQALALLTAQLDYFDANKNAAFEEFTTGQNELLNSLLYDYTFTDEHTDLNAVLNRTCELLEIVLTLTLIIMRAPDTAKLSPEAVLECMGEALCAFGAP